MDNPLYLYDLEYKNVIGVDEAGRGPLAGPVVAAAVILKEYSEELDEINDSKKLTEKKREKLYDIIMKNFYVAVGISTVEEIDKMNILNADFLAISIKSSNSFPLNTYSLLSKGFKNSNL